MHITVYKINCVYMYLFFDLSDMSRYRGMNILNHACKAGSSGCNLRPLHLGVCLWATTKLQLQSHVCGWACERRAFDVCRRRHWDFMFMSNVCEGVIGCLLHHSDSVHPRHCSLKLLSRSLKFVWSLSCTFAIGMPSECSSCRWTWVGKMWRKIMAVVKPSLRICERTSCWSELEYSDLLPYSNLCLHMISEPRRMFTVHVIGIPHQNCKNGVYLLFEATTQK